MDTLEVIAKAKDHIAEMFKGENITSIGLEAVELVERDQQWRVTIGFSRPWDHPLGIAAAVGGRVLAVKHRALATAD